MNYFCTWLSTGSRMIWWKHYPFSPQLPLHHCQKSVDYTRVDLFLSSLLCSVYSYADGNITLPLFLVLQICSFSKLFWWFWILWISTLILELVCKFFKKLYWDFDWECRASINRFRRIGIFFRQMAFYCSFSRKVFKNCRCLKWNILFWPKQVSVGGWRAVHLGNWYS